MAVFNTIKIDNKTIYRGNDMTLQREFIYAGEIETCTGKRCADLVGWRYADITLEWDTLPDSQLMYLIRLTGQAVTMEFKDERMFITTETVIPRLITSTATRFTDPYGIVPMWKGISLQLTFIEAHS